MLAAKNMTVAEFCEKLQFSRPGLQKSLDNDLMASNKVLEACEILGISPNEFLEWEPSDTTMAAEPVPYRSSAIKKNLITDNATIDVLVRHIAWLETEIDRLRGVGGKKRSAAV